MDAAFVIDNMYLVGCLPNNNTYSPLNTQQITNIQQRNLDREFANRRLQQEKELAERKMQYQYGKPDSSNDCDMYYELKRANDLKERELQLLERKYKLKRLTIDGQSDETCNTPLSKYISLFNNKELEKVLLRIPPKSELAILSVEGNLVQVIYNSNNLKEQTGYIYLHDIDCK